MVWVDEAGEVVHIVSYDLAAGAPAPVPAGLLEQLGPESPLLTFPEEAGGAAGLLQLPDGPRCSSPPARSCAATAAARGGAS